MDAFEANLTSVHLPDVHGPVGTAHHQVVVRRSPLDHLDGEKVAGRQHDAFLLPQAEESYRVIAGDRADAVLDSRLNRERQKETLTSVLTGCLQQFLLHWAKRGDQQPIYR